MSAFTGSNGTNMGGPVVQRKMAKKSLYDVGINVFIEQCFGNVYTMSTKCLVIDTRPVERFYESHVIGALNVPFAAGATCTEKQMVDLLSVPEYGPLFDNLQNYELWLYSENGTELSALDVDLSHPVGCARTRNTLRYSTTDSTRYDAQISFLKVIIRSYSTDMDVIEGVQSYRTCMLNICLSVNVLAGGFTSINAYKSTYVTRAVGGAIQWISDPASRASASGSLTLQSKDTRKESAQSELLLGGSASMPQQSLMSKGDSRDKMGYVSSDPPTFEYGFELVRTLDRTDGRAQIFSGNPILSKLNYRHPRDAIFSDQERVPTKVRECGPDDLWLCVSSPGVSKGWIKQSGCYSIARSVYDVRLLRDIVEQIRLMLETAEYVFLVCLDFANIFLPLYVCMALETDTRTVSLRELLWRLDTRHQQPRIPPFRIENLLCMCAFEIARDHKLQSLPNMHFADAGEYTNNIMFSTLGLREISVLAAVSEDPNIVFFHMPSSNGNLLSVAVHAAPFAEHKTCIIH